VLHFYFEPALHKKSTQKKTLLHGYLQIDNGSEIQTTFEVFNENNGVTSYKVTLTNLKQDASEIILKLLIGKQLRLWTEGDHVIDESFNLIGMFDPAVKYRLERVIKNNNSAAKQNLTIDKANEILFNVICANYGLFVAEAIHLRKKGLNNIAAKDAIKISHILQDENNLDALEKAFKGIFSADDLQNDAVDNVYKLPEKQMSSRLTENIPWAFYKQCTKLFKDKIK
jgi:hypothetical protein